MQIRLDPFIFITVCDEILREAGVKIYYHCSPIAIECDKNGARICAVEKNKRMIFQSKTVIDATGDANIAEMAGFATEHSETLQPATLIQNISGYDKCKINSDTVISMYNEALKNGALSEGVFQHNDPVNAFREGRISMHIHVNNASSCEGKTELELTARATLKRILEFVRTVPGGENIYVSSFATECGVRETKRIIGEGRMTVENYVSGYVYPDAIAYCFYPVDLHEKIGIHQIHLEKGVVPTIPYSALIPKGSCRLLVAGRCAAGDTEANSAYRVQASCMAMGQAAGIAAAIAVRSDISVKDVPINDIRDELKSIGAIVPEKS